MPHETFVSRRRDAGARRTVAYFFPACSNTPSPPTPRWSPGPPVGVTGGSVPGSRLIARHGSTPPPRVRRPVGRRVHVRQPVATQRAPSWACPLALRALLTQPQSLSDIPARAMIGPRRGGARREPAAYFRGSLARARSPIRSPRLRLRLAQRGRPSRAPYLRRWPFSSLLGRRKRARSARSPSWT